jgi:hypothetical protein
LFGCEFGRSGFAAFQAAASSEGDGCRVFPVVRFGLVLCDSVVHDGRGERVQVGWAFA